MAAKVMTAEEAVRLIPDNAALGVGGFVGAGRDRLTNWSDGVVCRRSGGWGRSRR